MTGAQIKYTRIALTPEQVGALQDIFNEYFTNDGDIDNAPGALLAQIFPYDTLHSPHMAVAWYPTDSGGRAMQAAHNDSVRHYGAKRVKSGLEPRLIEHVA